MQYDGSTYRIYTTPTTGGTTSAADYSNYRWVSTHAAPTTDAGTIAEGLWNERPETNMSYSTFSLVRIPDSKALMNKYIFLRTSEQDSLGREYLSYRKVRDLISSKYPIPPLLLNELEVPEKDMKIRRRWSHAPVLFRLRSIDELERLYGNRSDIEAIYALCDTIRYRLENDDMVAVDSRYLHDLIMMDIEPTRSFNTNNTIHNMTIYRQGRGVESDSPELNGFHYTTTISDISASLEHMTTVFDYSCSDLMLIHYQIIRDFERRRHISLFDNAMSKFKHDRSVFGYIAVVETEVPDINDIPNTYYYPRSWQIDAGYRRRMYAFFPSRKAIRYGYMPGIFSPAGNLIPICYFNKRITVKDYITPRFKMGQPFGQSLKYRLRGKATVLDLEWQSIHNSGQTVSSHTASASATISLHSHNVDYASLFDGINLENVQLGASRVQVPEYHIGSLQPVEFNPPPSIRPFGISMSGEILGSLRITQAMEDAFMESLRDSYRPLSMSIVPAPPDRFVSIADISLGTSGNNNTDNESNGGLESGT